MNRRTIIADFTVPEGSKVEEKEIDNVWKTKTKVVLVIVGVEALGSVSTKRKGCSGQIGIPSRMRTGTVKKSALLGSAHILGKVLEI